MLADNTCGTRAMVTGIPREVLRANARFITKLRLELERLEPPAEHKGMLRNIRSVRFAVWTMTQLGSTRIEEWFPYSDLFCYDVMTSEQADEHLATRDSKFETAYLFHVLPFCPHQYIERPVTPKFINILNFVSDIKTCYYRTFVRQLGISLGG